MAPSENKYLYNRKELQDELLGGVNLDWYDYGARFYDPALGRWHSPDPLADNAHNLAITPYHYTNNNPIAFVDLFGLDWFYYQKEDEDAGGWHWHEDGTYTHTYTDEAGNEKTGKKELQGYEMLAVYEITGENKEGAATGTMTLYGEGYGDVLESSSGVFTGGGPGNYPPAGEGNYLMDFGREEAPIVSHDGVGYILKPTTGYNEFLAGNAKAPDGTWVNFGEEWGDARIRLNGDKGRFLYLHGKELH